jgi:hypothetical protein
MALVFNQCKMLKRIVVSNKLDCYHNMLHHAALLPCGHAATPHLCVCADCYPVPKIDTRVLRALVLLLVSMVHCLRVRGPILVLVGSKGLIGEAGADVSNLDSHVDKIER